VDAVEPLESGSGSARVPTRLTRVRVEDDVPGSAAPGPLLLEGAGASAAAVERLLAARDACVAAGRGDLVLALRPGCVADAVRGYRLLAARLSERGPAHPLHLVTPARGDRLDALVDASTALGALLLDGIGDSVEIDADVGGMFVPRLAFHALQATGVRITRAEFVACPGCGRTLFDLESTTNRIKQRTDHLTGVRIAVMGCVVNGPGEMADADFGYVGGAPGRVNLYVGRQMVERNVPEEAAADRLVELIRAHGRWSEAPAREPGRA
jgi:(E)-4-hydroxy-3-methylbut-2-enyl-diphosphate synthase